MGIVEHAVGIDEDGVALRISDEDPPTTFVDCAMMSSAQQDEVVHCRSAAVAPPGEVVSVGPFKRSVAARKATALIAQT